MRGSSGRREHLRAIQLVSGSCVDQRLREHPHVRGIGLVGPVGGPGRSSRFGEQTLPGETSHGQGGGPRPAVGPGHRRSATTTSAGRPKGVRATW